MTLSRTPVLVFLWAGLACGDNMRAQDAGPEPVDAYIPAERAPFPDGFLWGTAIAPYQVEGGLTGTDWYQWETLCEHCSGDSAEDGPGFWQRYAADLDGAVAMSNNTIRLGIDWSRVFPTAESFPDSPDAAAVAHYHEILQAARDRNLEPMVTLVHFALPTWVHDLENPESAPGWEGEEIIDLFAAYADWIAGEFGGEVDLWITLNEPFVNITGGWISGDVPPGKSFEIELALEVGLNMVSAHARAYDRIHETDVVDANGDGLSAMVSISKHNRIFLPKDPENEMQVAAADMLRYILNSYFLEAVVYGNIDNNFDFDFDDPEDVVEDPELSGRLDFIGLNYYGVTIVIETANHNNFPLIGIPLINDLDRQGFEGPKSDFGWSLYAPGLREVIDEIVRFDLPIYITENGLADSQDTMRSRFLVEHLYEVQRAIEDGIDIRGYYHWSLTDNFEWGSGYCPRFGLYAIDFEDPDKPRTMRDSAQTYRRIIDESGVDPQLFGETSYGMPSACPRVGF